MDGINVLLTLDSICVLANNRLVIWYNKLEKKYTLQSAAEISYKYLLLSISGLLYQWGIKNRTERVGLDKS